MFHENLTKYDDKSLVSWQTYQPKQGDSLEAIAKRFGVTRYPAIFVDDVMLTDIGATTLAKTVLPVVRPLVEKRVGP